MNPILDFRRSQTRREVFSGATSCLGAAALSQLLGGMASAAPATPAPKVRRVIYLFQNGGPSHIEMFDPKPKLTEMHGQPFPESVTQGLRFSTMTQDKKKLCLGQVTETAPAGKCGMELSSSHLPYTSEIADKITLIRSMYTEQVNHAPAITFFLSGGERPGRPSMGAWLSYGIGSEADNLPAFVCMTSISKGTSCGQIFYDHYWGSGFLPSVHQGVKFRGNGNPVLYLENPDGISKTVRRGLLDDLAKLNQKQYEALGDPEIQSRISQYEMAYKMQTSVPELTDFSKESKATLDMYGPSVHEKGTYAYNCLMARRLVERGTRFVQVMHAGWDQHNSITTEFNNQTRDTDQPSAALIKDLEQRGLLDDTLVIFGGEFGRTPFLQNDIKDRKRWGRDHHPYGFSMWMAGGGMKQGYVHGATDEFGFHAVEDRMHVHDFQATVLHQLGIDHEKLTYKFQGRRFRLTDVHGHVVKDILA
ncbi:MAG: DUF1501 domain-containing protein [Verrucomicrobiales bacterium]|jgi:hypothetical protein|nr:DUF1501 domain-containing protein [Verrucomicrobiales bacterium]